MRLYYLHRLKVQCLGDHDKNLFNLYNETLGLQLW